MRTPSPSRRPVVLAGLLALTLGLLAGPAAADFTRSDHTTYTDKETQALRGQGTREFDVDDGGALGGSPTGVAAADFNGDGQDDLAATTQNAFGAEEAWSFPDGVVILFSQPDSSYRRPVFYPLGTDERSYGTSPVPTFLAEAGERGATAVTAADLNGDTRPDLAVANKDTDSVSVLINTLNTGTGTVESDDVDDPTSSGSLGFAVPVRYVTGPSPVAIATGNLDGQNGLDLVTANVNGDNVTVLLNQGNGTFPRNGGQTVSVGTSPRGVATADLDNGNHDDVVTANAGSDDVSVLLNDGSGGLGAEANSPYAVGTRPQGIAAAKLDGDPHPDVVTANAGSDNVSVLANLLNDGDASTGLSPETNSPYGVGADPVDVVVADVDGDGDGDVATANKADNDVSALLNDGSAGLSTETNSPYAVGTRPMGLAVLNPGDVDPDLVTANNLSNNLTVLHNQNGGSTSTASTDTATTDRPQLGPSTTH